MKVSTSINGELEVPIDLVNAYKNESEESPQDDDDFHDFLTDYFDNNVQGKLVKKEIAEFFSSWILGEVSFHGASARG